MNTALRILLIATLAVSGCFYLAGFDEIAPNEPATTSTGGGTSTSSSTGGTGATGGTGGSGGGGGVEVVTPWAKWYGVDGQNEKPQAVTIGSEGDVFAAGYYSPSNGESLDIGGVVLPGMAAGSALFVFKLNTNGSTEWARNWDSDTSLEARALALDSSENILLAVTFSGANPFSLGQCARGAPGVGGAGGSAGAGGSGGAGGAAAVGGGPVPGAALVRLDGENGNVIDCHAWLDPETVTITDLDYDQDRDRFAVVGYRETSSRGKDGFLWFFDGPLNSLSQVPEERTFTDESLVGAGGSSCGGSSSDSVDQEALTVALERKDDGKIYVGGVFDGQMKIGNDTLQSNCRDAWMVSVYSSSLSSVQWATSFGEDSSLQDIQGLALSPDAQWLWITGRMVGSVAGYDNAAKSEPGTDGDVYLGKYGAANGQPAFTKRWGDGSEQFGQALAVDKLGEVVVVGLASGIVNFPEGNDTISGDSYGDFMVFKFAEDGTFRWANSFVGDSFQVATDVAVDPVTRAVAFGGYASGATTIGTDTLGTAGFLDTHIVVAKLLP